MTSQSECCPTRKYPACVAAVRAQVLSAPWAARLHRRSGIPFGRSRAPGPRLDRSTRRWPQGHRAQLGVAISATENGCDGGLGLLEGLGNSERAVHIAWKGGTYENETWLMLRQRFER